MPSWSPTLNLYHFLSLFLCCLQVAYRGGTLAFASPLASKKAWKKSSLKQRQLPSGSKIPHKHPWNPNSISLTPLHESASPLLALPAEVRRLPTGQASMARSAPYDRRLMYNFSRAPNALNAGCRRHLPVKRLAECFPPGSWLVSPSRCGCQLPPATAAAKSERRKRGTSSRTSTPIRTRLALSRVIVRNCLRSADHVLLMRYPVMLAVFLVA